MSREVHIPSVGGYCDSGVYLECSCGWDNFQPQKNDPDWLGHLGAAPWAFTDDPDDPCPYCVQWTEADDIEDALPIWPDGTVAPRIYRFTHLLCTAAVLDYVMSTAE